MDYRYFYLGFSIKLFIRIHLFGSRHLDSKPGGQYPSAWVRISVLVTKSLKGNATKVPSYLLSKIVRIHHFFLNFYIGSDIIIYNAVGVVYTPWQMDVDMSALLNGRALFISALFWKEQILWLSVIKDSGNCLLIRI